MRSESGPDGGARRAEEGEQRAPEAAIPVREGGQTSKFMLTLTEAHRVISLNPIFPICNVSMANSTGLM